MSTPDPVAIQTYTDGDNAFSIATKLWSGAPLKPTPEAFQATVATLLIHMKELRRTAPQVPAASQAGHVRAAAPARPAPAPATPSVPACPKCGGEMWDNREGKKNPKSPDFKCKDKTCLDDKGMVTALWVRDLKKTTAYAQAAAIRDAFDEMPAALQDDDPNALPF